jgi:tripartite-type tricarboxylate transporter receptor subunit TctC
LRAQENYPNKPVRIIVAFSPGGGTDTLTRALAVPLGKALNQTVIVENKPGAGAVVGSEYVAKAQPDGYTLLVTSAPHASNPSLVNLPYDTVKGFAPVCLAAESPFMLVVPPDSPINTLEDLIKEAKKRKLTFASSGIGTNDHLSVELLSHIYGVSMTHVPYKGTGPALVDVVGKHIDLMAANIVGAGTLVKAGKLRAIAVTTARRSSLFPNIPALQELIGKPFDVSAWTGILTPAGTPKAIVDRLNKDIRQSLTTDAVKEAMATQGADIVADTPEHFQQFIVSEIDKWSALIKAAGITTNS